MASFDVESSSKKRKRGGADPEPSTKEGKKKELRRRNRKPKNKNGTTDPNGAPKPSTIADLALQRSLAGDEAINGEHAEEKASGWVVSKPLGGRMADIDPILTKDDAHLIIAYLTSIQVYSTSDSLLLRSIQIPHTVSEDTTRLKIVALRLSMQSEELAWVACSDGKIWTINWMTGTVQPTPVNPKGETVMDMVVLWVPLNGVPTELLVVAQHSGSGKDEQQIVAYHPQGEHKRLLDLPESCPRLRNMHVLPDQYTILASCGTTLVVGILFTTDEFVTSLRSTWYQFETPQIITSLDARAEPAIMGATSPIVDVTVGGVRGAIHIYRDLVRQLDQCSVGGKLQKAPSASKRIWHRRAVHTLKWSRDGHYIISGGSERTMVLWQLDTNRKSFLPHMPAAIEHIVVSETGSSYVIRLDDNSVMVLSTVTMEPTAYIAGIQSVTNEEVPKDHWVSRLGGVDTTKRYIPAALHPQDPPRFYVCVGSGSQATTSGGTRSTPFLQTVDLESLRSMGKQAITRNQAVESVTDVEGRPLTDPKVEHLAFSCDGKWLATVDDWTPTVDNSLNMSADQQEMFSRERKEIYLKFWEVSEGDKPLPLVTRIDSPHATNSPEDVLDLASDPKSTRFATVGNDGIVRIWKPRVRQQDGIVQTAEDGRTLHNWGCSQIIVLSDQLGVANVGGTERVPNQGSLAFSDDGSTLFVAFGSAAEGSVYVIDVTSGDVRATLDGLWSGNLSAIRALSPYIIVLSNSLVVYDVVADELCYGLLFNRRPKSELQAETVHLEVDRNTRHFAVAAPAPFECAELNVFSPEIPTPSMSKRIPGRVLSLVSRPETSGFVALDDRAQLWTISEAEDPEGLTIAQPLDDMRLDATGEAGEATDSNGVMVLDEDVEGASDGEDEAEVVDGDSMDIDSEDEEADPAVISQQKLAAIFDAAPAFAMPAIEDVFYKVAGLLATKRVVPLVT